MVLLPNIIIYTRLSGEKYAVMHLMLKSWIQLDFKTYAC